MSSCCDANACPTATDRGEVCPRCGTKGKAVDLSTVKALLTETALARIEPGAYRFCLASTCDTVYFDGSGRIFTRGDVRVPVWQKERVGNRVVCYCFGENEADIRAEVVSHG